MDVVLELTDTFIADYLYALALPAKSIPYDFLDPTTNTTVQDFSSWEFKTVNPYFHFEPTKYAYMSEWNRDNIYRQFTTLFLVTWIFGFVLYFLFATLSYLFVFDKKTMQHPKYLKHQMWLEIKQAMQSMPGMSALTVPFWLMDVRGYTRLYNTPADGPGMWYEILQYPFFILFTDACIYLIHRGLHHPLIYKRLHKPHHKWIMPTPYASHAFHPVDGWAQSLPYHIFPLLFPLNKFASVGLFVFVNFWTIMIHDGEYVANSPVINGAACHTMHHLYFNYNYGQYTTFWDRLGQSYRKPDEGLFQKEQKMSEDQWKKQVKEMEKMVKEVEGEDDRTYDPAGVKKNN
ncbi:C-5 sterol desaturase [Annulohypoxylon truncatum]|uniref:C-5 sterol desaturase n=1 Tax=Annulohypoxylon truncatum TaxID=327061 RepID=UPI002007B000|nr:C-5 sterol desaturase [Annulohypoxylon truncatum]KAI1212987.1 C-5 sterol desaturase [Annulohypoxylon truncatum]